MTITIAALLVSAGAQAVSCPDAARLTNGLKGAQATIRYLADDALEGRLAGSSGERCAGDFIAQRFKALGLQPGGAQDSYFQEVPLASVLNPHANAGTGRNVIALLPGTHPQLRHEWVIVGAHYDHLGLGGASSLARGQTAIHNGADDNASGVAALLEIARALAAAKPARSVAFLAFTGEESGLIGSRLFTSHPAIPLRAVKAMLNLDMVGRLGAGPLIIYGTGTAKEWDAIVATATRAEGVEFKAQPEGYGPSDHTSFYMADIPVLHFFTNVHGDYHQPTDDWDKIDHAGLNKVAAVVTRVARSVANAPAAITLVRGAGQPPATGVVTRGSAYLGTVPDFTPVERGVLLSGVTAGSPGDRAGLRKGDIIVRFDDDVIADLQGMTDALRKRKPGDTVKVTVLRDGKEVVVTAVLGTRGR